MATTISRLSIAMGMDTTGLRQGIVKSEELIGQLRDSVAGISAKLSVLFGSFGAAGFAGWGVKLAADAEQAQIAFQVMLVSAERARLMLSQLRDFAATSPFSFPDLQESARTMLAFGVASYQVIPLIQMLADVAGGNSQKLQQLSLAFSQISSTGRLTGQDLLQLINAGFNPLQEISEKTGKSIAELRKELQNGNITFEMVVAALQSATEEGGRFHGMMDQMSASLAGQFAQLRDELEAIARTIGEFFLPSLKKGVEAMKSLTGSVSQMNVTMVRNVANVTAFVAGFSATIAIAPLVVKAIKAIIQALRSMASAKALVQALSGPKGWATLAAGLAIGAASAYAVNAMFDQFESSMQSVADETNVAAEAQTEMAKELDFVTEAASETNKELERLRRRGQQIADAVRTPAEVAADKMNELNALVKVGAINGETYSRAMKKVQQDLFRATEQAKEFRDVGRVEVGALTRHSTEAFSAVMRSQYEQRRQAELQKQQLEHQKRQTALLEEANRLARERAKANVKEVGL